MYQGYRIETGYAQVEKWIREDENARYKTVKTSSGTKYRVKMTEEESEDWRRLGMIAAVGGVFPLCMGIMAWAAGLLG